MGLSIEGRRGDYVDLLCQSLEIRRGSWHFRGESFGTRWTFQN